jgi:uroporphyrinogen-III decarboxylase
MSLTSKELVRALFAGKPKSRPPFIPYMATAAAQFMQVPVKQLFSDPTTLANSLQACQRLFKYDGIAILLDTTLEAEACGCQIAWQEKEPPTVVSHPLERQKPENLDISGIESKGRIPVVLEAAKRLAQTAGKDVALLGVITGPITLSKCLMGDNFIHALGKDTQSSQKVIQLSEKIALTLARAYGELKFDAIILADSDLASLYPVYYPAIQPTLKTLRNLVNFYDAPLIILTRRVPPVLTDRFSAFMKFEADGFSLGNHDSELKTLPLSSDKLLGRCIPRSALLGSVDDIAKATLELLNNRSIGNRFFITSEWEVPLGTPALNLHRVMQTLAASAAK